MNEKLFSLHSTLSLSSFITLPSSHTSLTCDWGCHMIRQQETFGSLMKKWKVWQPRLPRLVYPDWLDASVVNASFPSCFQDSQMFVSVRKIQIVPVALLHFSNQTTQVCNSRHFFTIDYLQTFKTSLRSLICL